MGDDDDSIGRVVSKKCCLLLCLLHGGGGFFGKQCAAVAFSSVWAFGFTWSMLWIIDHITPVRVDPAHEATGLDTGLHGELRD